jgi:hypothetical protein
LVGYKAFKLQKLHGEAPVPSLVSPTQRNIRWWTMEHGVLHWADDEPAWCYHTSEKHFDENGYGIVTKYGHKPPDLECNCGYHIHHDYESAHRYYNPRSPGHSSYRYGQEEYVDPVPVVALVWGYGDWLVNELTFRSEYMKFAAFRAVPGFEMWTRVIAEDFGVPHLSIDELKEYASQAGASGKEIWRARNGTQEGSGDTWQVGSS